MQRVGNPVEQIKTIKYENKGIECDKCKNIIEPAPSVNKELGKYYQVVTGHHDWGNDSFESRKYWDICPDCLMPFVIDYFQNASGTSYIEIETARTILNTFVYK